jgi:PAS domain S-box-containing protein
MAIDPPAEIPRLRTALRDLVALSAMPAAWVGREPPAIVAGLADVLVGSLHLDFVFVRLCDPNGGAAVDVTRGNAWKAFPEWLQHHLAVFGQLSRKEIIPDVGAVEPCCGVVIPIGINAEGGLVAAACDRTDFPTETDQLLLSVAANHAATAFQSARLIYERRRAEEELRQARDELEMKVAERTAELRRSEAYLAEAQRLSHTGSWAFNTGGGIHWSEENFRIWDFDPQQGPPDTETVLQRTHPEDRDRVYEVFQKALREKRHFTHEFRIVLPDGAVKHIQTIGHPVLDETGEVVEYVGTAVDVTERKQAEEERQAHLWFLESMDQVNRAIQGTNDLEQMMSDVLDAVLSIFNCDRAWLVYPCDPEALSWKVPMEHTRAEFPGAFAVGLDLPVDPDIARVFQTVRASSGPVRFGPASEHPLPAEAAKRFSIQSMIGTAIYPKGDKPYMLGLHQCSYPRVWTPHEERLFQEIRRRLEDELTSLLMFRNLAESERKLEEAQRLTHVGYWERDPDTDLITWSDETYRIFGLKPQERALHLAELPELIHPEDKQIVLDAVAEALRGGRRYDVEYRVVRPNGDVRLVHSKGDVTRDESGRPRRMFGSVQDITERKQAEQRLRAQYTVTQLLAEAATLEEVTPRILQTVCEFLLWDLGVLWSLDREAGVLRCVEVWHKESVEAPQFEAISRESTFMPGIGLPGRVWSRHEPAYIPDVVHDANFSRASIAAREGLHAAFGIPILLGGDVLGVMEFFGREIRQPEQELFNMMATLGSQIGQFIERKRAEEKLHKAQAELAYVTRIMTLGELTASIAHEVNQPLAAVVTNANACLRWLAGTTPNLNEAREALGRITRDGKRASEVIGRIRALVKKSGTEQVPLDSNEVIQEVAGLIQSEIQKNDVLLRMELAPDLPPVLGDRVQLQQVILNIVMNGVEAMASVADRRRELLIRSRQHGSDQVLVTVQDCGAGIDRESLEKVFDPFYTTKPQGMGMGLAISRSIIENHGGRLWVVPNEGPGATFHFTLVKYH